MMKEVILLENIMNLGNIGDKVTVKNGYGRNFLLKTGKALRFNKENQENAEVTNEASAIEETEVKSDVSEEEPKEEKAEESEKGET